MADSARPPTGEARTAPAGGDGVPGPGDWSLAEWERRSAGTLAERLGVRLLEVGVDRVVGTMPVAGNTQPFGLLHGGASAALAETLGSIAATLHAGPGRAAVGTDLGASHHRGARDDGEGGLVTGVASPLSLGRTLACYEIVVSDDTGRRLCTARLTCLLRDLPPAG